MLQVSLLEVGTWADYNMWSGIAIMWLSMIACNHNTCINNVRVRVILASVYNNKMCIVYIIYII